MLEITALMDNKPSANRGLKAEHGLSLYVQYEGHTIVFDCGGSSATLHNAHKLGIDLEKPEAVVLSHNHYDHAAGYRDLVESGKGRGTLYLGKSFFQKKYAQKGMAYCCLSGGFTKGFLEENAISHEFVEDVLEIFPGAYLIGGFPSVTDYETIPARFVLRTQNGMVPDAFADEICLALQMEGGLALVVGCSHPGIVNMVTHVRQVLGQPVKAVFGGTHLVEADEVRMEKTVSALKSLGLEILGLSHCSGDGADEAIAKAQDVCGCHLAVGDSVFLP